MATTYYKLDLFTRALRSWHPVSALGLVWRIVRTQLLYERKYVYGLSMSELDRVPTFDIGGYRVEAMSDPPKIRQLAEELQAYPGMLPDDCWRLHAAGAVFWVGRLHGELANLGVSRRGIPTWNYFWPLVSGYVSLSHFATIPKHRGRGLYPALLAHIVREMAHGPTEYFLVECGDWNSGSRRGIERVGFRHLGYGKATVRGRLSWYPLAPEARGVEVLNGRCPVKHRVLAETAQVQS